MHPINEYGTDAQKEKYLPRLGVYPFSLDTQAQLTSIISKRRAHWLFCKANVVPP